MKNLVLAALLACTLGSTVNAQRKPFEINTQTPEGIQLTLAGSESDEAKKVALLEEFLQRFPKHTGVVYAGSQLQEIYLKAGKGADVIRVAEAMLAVDPSYEAAGFNALQAAEQAKDYAGIKAWALRTVEATKKTLASPKPTDDEALEAWTKEQDYAKQVATRCEYALFHAAAETQDPKAKADLGGALWALNPGGPYMAQALPHYLFGLAQIGRGAEIAGVAEKAVELDKNNDAMIVTAAESYLALENYDKVAIYAKMLFDTMPAKAAPQGMDAAQWEKTKADRMARANYYSGRVANAQKNWADEDKSMRAALPLAAGNNDLLGPINFYLGFANYEMAKAPKAPAKAPAKAAAKPPYMADAKKFTAACAEIPGPYQETCKKNLAGMAAGK